MQSSSWFTLLFSRLRDYQFYPVTLAVLHKAYFVWGQEHPKLAPVESSEGRENQRKLGYQQVYPRSYWELQAWKRNIPQGRGTGLLDQCLGTGETLRLFRTKKILKYIPGLLKTTHLILLGQRTRRHILKSFIVISFVPLEYKQISSSTPNQSVMLVLPCL